MYSRQGILGTEGERLGTPFPRTRLQSFDVHLHHEYATDSGDENPLLMRSCDFDTLVYKLSSPVLTATLRILMCASESAAVVPPYSSRESHAKSGTLMLSLSMLI